MLLCLQRVTKYSTFSRIQKQKAIRVMESSSVTYVFQEIEPGWSCIHFSDPPKVQKSRFHALMQDALGFAADNPLPGTNVVLVSRRRVAIVIVRQKQQAYLMTFARLLATLQVDFAMQIGSQFDAWAIPEAQGYFCSVLPDEYRP